MITIPSQMPQRSDHTASSTVILVERRPQSLAFGDPCGALGIDPVAQPGSGAMMPLRVRCDPQLPKTMQREHHDEATEVLPATFLNEAIRPSILFVAAQMTVDRVLGAQRATIPPVSRTSPGRSAASQAARSNAGHSARGTQRLDLADGFPPPHGLSGDNGLAASRLAIAPARI